MMLEKTKNIFCKKLDNYSETTSKILLEAPCTFKILNSIFYAVISSNNEQELLSKLNSIIPSDRDQVIVVSDYLRNLNTYIDLGEALMLMSANCLRYSYALIAKNPKIELDQLLDHFSSPYFEVQDRNITLNNFLKKDI